MFFYYGCCWIFFLFMAEPLGERQDVFPVGKSPHRTLRSNSLAFKTEISLCDGGSFSAVPMSASLFQAQFSRQDLAMQWCVTLGRGGSLPLPLLHWGEQMIHETQKGGNYLFLPDGALAKSLRGTFFYSAVRNCLEKGLFQARLPLLYPR